MENISTSSLLSYEKTSESNDSFEVSFLFLFRYFIAIIGLVANCLVIFCIYSYKKLQKVRNYLVANLAVIDALSLIMDLTVFIPSEVPSYGKIINSCFFSVAGNTLTFMGMIALTVVSVDRFVYIMRPLHYHYFRKHWIKTVLSSWLVFGTCHAAFGVLFTCPAFYVENEMIYNFSNLVSFSTWFVVEAVLYSIIYWKAYRQNLSLGRSQAANESANRSFNPIQKRIIIGYLLIVGFAFLTSLFSNFLAIMFLVYPDEMEFSGFLKLLQVSANFSIFSTSEQRLLRRVNV